MHHVFEDLIKQQVVNMLLKDVSNDSVMYWLRAKHAIWSRMAMVNYEKGKHRVAGVYHSKANVAVQIQWELDHKQLEEGVIHGA